MEYVIASSETTKPKVRLWRAISLVLKGLLRFAHNYFFNHITS